MSKTITLDFQVYRQHDSCCIYTNDARGEEKDVTWLFTPEELTLFRIEMDESWLAEQAEQQTDEAIQRRLFNE